MCKQLASGKIENQTIHLCFTCDPYPKGVDSSVTREIIKAIKGLGCNVSILTKNGEDAERDFDLLDENDWFGITYAGYEGYSFRGDINNDYIPLEEPNSGTVFGRLLALYHAHKKGIKTWVSAEPVLYPEKVLEFIELADYVDKWYIGKLNYRPSEVNWKEFGKKAERVCIEHKRDFYIKDSLKKEMNA